MPKKIKPMFRVRRLTADVAEAWGWEPIDFHGDSFALAWGRYGSKAHARRSCRNFVERLIRQCGYRPATVDERPIATMRWEMLLDQLIEVED